MSQLKRLPFRIRLRLKRPSSSIENLLTSPYLTPVSPKAYAEHANRFLNDRFVGTGPYILSSFRNTQQRLLPFRNYWGAPPKNIGLDLINLSNSTALFGALVSGEVDVLLSDSLDEDQKRALSHRANQKLIRESKGPAMNITFVTLRTNTPPLKSQIVRQALAHSLDRHLISTRVSYKQRTPLRSLIPPSLQGGKTEPWPTYNLEKARKLFEKAGYCKGRQLQIAFTYRTNVPSDRLMALTWQAQLKRDLPNCVNMTLNGVESTTVYKQLSEGSFQAVILDWGGSYPDPEAYLAPLLSCKRAKETFVRPVKPWMAARSGLHQVFKKPYVAATGWRVTHDLRNWRRLMRWQHKGRPTFQSGLSLQKPGLNFD